MRKDTKARDFDRKAKMAISRRDSIDGWPCCVYCGLAAPEPLAWSNAHFIARSQGGFGIPENGLTLCPLCHRRYDQTTARAQMREFFREYLKTKYENWSEDALIYRKGSDATAAGGGRREQSEWQWSARSESASTDEAPAGLPQQESGLPRSLGPRNDKDA